MLMRSQTPIHGVGRFADTRGLSTRSTTVKGGHRSQPARASIHRLMVTTTIAVMSKPRAISPGTVEIKAELMSAGNRMLWITQMARANR